MKRVIAFALALAAVFGVSFALYKPEEARQSRETYDREWVGYFFALEEFEGRAYAVKNGEEYDFSVPGVPIFLTITEIGPGEPGYEEGSEFNCVIGAVVGEGADSHGMSVSGSDDGETYEIGGDRRHPLRRKPAARRQQGHWQECAGGKSRAGFRPPRVGRFLPREHGRSEPDRHGHLRGRGGPLPPRPRVPLRKKRRLRRARRDQHG